MTKYFQLRKDLLVIAGTGNYSCFFLRERLLEESIKTAMMGKEQTTLV